MNTTYSIHLGTSPETLTRLATGENIVTLINGTYEKYADMLNKFGYCVCEYEYNQSHGAWVSHRIVTAKQPKK